MTSIKKKYRQFSPISFLYYLPPYIPQVFCVNLQYLAHIRPFFWTPYTCVKFIIDIGPLWNITRMYINSEIQLSKTTFGRCTRSRFLVYLLSKTWKLLHVYLFCHLYVHYFIYRATEGRRPGKKTDPCYS